MTDSIPNYRFEPNSRAIFEKAVEDGIISRESANNGDIMYMYSCDNYHYFKHRDTKDYVKVAA